MGPPPEMAILPPDTRVDAATAARFGEVREAYGTLRDPVLRAAYDQSREPASDRRRDSAPPARPARRYAVLLGTARPEPALRAGPVRWERTFRRGPSPRTARETQRGDTKSRGPSSPRVTLVPPRAAAGGSSEDDVVDAEIVDDDKREAG